MQHMAEKETKQVGEFLRYVVEGEQDKAEQLLKVEPSLAIKKGEVTDLSGREFKGITGLQYVVWGLDWHMGKMLLKYLDKKEAGPQIVEWKDKGVTYKLKGKEFTEKHFDLRPWLNLLRGYTMERSINQQTISFHSALLVKEPTRDWYKEFREAQLLLPAHLVNEYCRPFQCFDMGEWDSFADELPYRHRQFRTSDWVGGDWFTQGEQGQICFGNWDRGDWFAYEDQKPFLITRGVLGGACMVRQGEEDYLFKVEILGHYRSKKYHPPSCLTLSSVPAFDLNLEHDIRVLQRLWEKRQQQFKELEIEFLVGRELNSYFPSVISSTVLGYLK